MNNYKGEIISGCNMEKYTLTLYTNTGGNITISANADCCSHSWFEYPNGLIPINKAIKSIEDENVNESDWDYLPVGDQECNIHHDITIYFDDDTEYHFLLTNSSNGYYDGWISISYN